MLLTFYKLNYLSIFFTSDTFDSAFDFDRHTCSLIGVTQNALKNLPRILPATNSSQQTRNAALATIAASFNAFVASEGGFKVRGHV